MRRNYKQLIVNELAKNNETVCQVEGTGLDYKRVYIAGEDGECTRTVSGANYRKIYERILGANHAS